MNIIYAILMWMIGLKLGMGNAYYIVIIIGAGLQLLLAGGKNQ
jgi:hypothetical protein